MKLKIKDKVKITAGKDRGREGIVKKVFPTNSKILIEGINKYKKHLKAQGEKKPGGIIEKERPLPVSNVALICSSCKQQTRVGYKIEKKGGKVRICKKCKSEI